MDDQDDFIMGNIISPSNTNNPLQFQSSQDKRKSKKEKYFAKKLLSNKRKREKKAPKENANTQSTFQKPFISKGYRPLLNRPKPETTTATTKTTEAATVIPQELQNDKTESNQQNNEIPLNENNQPILIEYNIDAFGLWVFQFTGNAAFGEYTPQTSIEWPL